MTTMCDTRTTPLAMSTASVPCSSPRTVSATSMTTWRGSRSATTPPSSTKSTNGNEYAASTTPTSAGLPVSRVTYSPMATMTSASPITLADWLSQRRRKLRDRSAENTPETVSALSAGFPALAGSGWLGPGWLDGVGNQGNRLARSRLPDSFTRPRHRRLGGSRSTTMPTTGEGGEQDSLHQPAALTGRVARTTCTWTMATVRGSGGHAVEHQRCQLGVRLRVGQSGPRGHVPTLDAGHCDGGHLADELRVGVSEGAAGHPLGNQGADPVRGDPGVALVHRAAGREIGDGGLEVRAGRSQLVGDCRQVSDHTGARVRAGRQHPLLHPAGRPPEKVRDHRDGELLLGVGERVQRRLRAAQPAGDVFQG